MLWSLAYADPIYPVPDHNEWPRHDTFVLPPVVKRRRGRKKLNRLPSIGEFSRR
ncbi:hypothetical protein F511_40351 [Dorcoceras hygrometricum]|uniref:Uncharacterized protein n=1 Tax=Dorcoceras hygrometricum TaxID=472368 RepID=A0A2Z7CEF6_9LAMI|nr:hypothetical protein F511_40351 [Dorcoceras hygrometricum]